MDKPAALTGGEVIMTDTSRLLAIYPHRDAEYSKITLQTNNLVIISCGVPGIPMEQLMKAADNAFNSIIKFCNE